MSSILVLLSDEAVAERAAVDPNYKGKIDSVP